MKAVNTKRDVMFLSTGLGSAEVTGVKGLIYDEEEVVFAICLIASKAAKTVFNEIEMGRTVPFHIPTAVGYEGKASHFFDLSRNFVDKKKKLENGTIVFSLVSSLASKKNPSLEKQYLLIPKMDSEEKELEVLKGEFIKNNLSKLPIPFKDSWLDYLWDRLKGQFIKLPSYGETPYSGYLFQVADLNIFEDWLEELHAMEEFQSKFKRVPRLRGLLAVSDIANFNFKDWMTFFGSYQEEFKALSVNEQRGVVQAYELLSSKNGNLIKKYANKWYTTSIRSVAIELRAISSKSEKDRYKSAFAACINHFSDKWNKISAVISLWGMIYKEHYKSIQNKNWVAIEKALGTIVYNNVRPEAMELAEVLGRNKVSQQEFEKYQAIYCDTLPKINNAPRALPTVSNNIDVGGWEVIEMSVPRAWVVGIETYCCMHLGSVGGACLEYAAHNPETSGILRVYDKKGKTLAQSFAWLSAWRTNSKGEQYRTMVLDNIETIDNSMRDSIAALYSDFAHSMKKYAKVFGIKYITVGTGYVSSSDLNKVAPEVADEEAKAPIPPNLRYSDARNQRLLAQLY